jgi:small subunit ribosomal protein S16
MAVHIRLARHGTKKAPFYRIVVADQRCKRDGRFIETLGTYDPRVSESGVRLNHQRLDFWRKQGAHTTDTVARLLKKPTTSPAEPAGV